MLFGNVMHWHTDYLGRQLPVLPERDGFPRKVKPLVRLTERETAAYCVVRGIDYIVEECPQAVGNKHLGYKEALNAIERQSPGTKHDFYFKFLSRASDRFRTDADAERDALRSCGVCGAPTTGDVCAFCRLVEYGPVASVEHAPVTLRTAPRPARNRGMKPFADGDRVLADRRQAAPVPRHLARRPAVPLALWLSRTRRVHRGRRGRHGSVHEGVELSRPATDARRLRAEDATRRTGDLSKGSRADPDAGRHLPRRAGARVGCRARVRCR